MSKRAREKRRLRKEAATSPPPKSWAPRKQVALFIINRSMIGGAERLSFEVAKRIPWECHLLVILDQSTMAFPWEEAFESIAHANTTRQNSASIARDIAARVAEIGASIVVATGQGPALFKHIVENCPVPVVDVVHSIPSWDRLKEGCHDVGARFIAVSTAVQQHIGVDGTRADCVPNGCDLRVFKPNSLPIVGTLGRIILGKNMEGFIKLAEEMKDEASFVWIGGAGPWAEEYWKVLAPRALEAGVIVTGYTQHPEHWLPMLDLFILPSEEEGSPLCVMEAMACGVPVVSTPVGNVQELVKDAGTVLSFRDFAWEIRRLLRDREALSQMGKRAREIAEECFDIDKTANGYMAAFEKAAKQPSVDLIMTAYKAKTTIHSAIQSIINQTYPLWRLIILLDGPDAGMRRIIEGFHDTRIEIHEQEHQGYARATTAALRLVNADYYTWMDADDLSDPDRLRRCVSFMESHPAIDLIYTGGTVSDDDFATERPWNSPQWSLKNYFENHRGSCPIGASKFIRGEWAKRLGGFDPSVELAADGDYLCRAHKAGARIHFLDLPLYRIRNHPQGMSKTQKAFDDFAEVEHRHSHPYKRILLDCDEFPSIAAWNSPIKAALEEDGHEIVPINWEQENTAYDGAFIWNGTSDLKSPFVQRLCSAGVPLLFSEHGWFPQKDTFYFDPLGVNYASTITKWLPANNWQHVRQGRVFAEKYRLLKECPEIVDDGYVLLILQVECDSQIVLYSDFERMEELVDLVIGATHLPVVVKPHPKERPRFDTTAFPRATFVDMRAPLYPLIAKAKAVVTINSTVGVEAFCWNKPVVTLGKAFYGGRGLTHAIGRHDRVADALAAIQWEEPFNQREREEFLGYLSSRQWSLQDLQKPLAVRALVDFFTSGALPFKP